MVVQPDPVAPERASEWKIKKTRMESQWNGKAQSWRALILRRQLLIRHGFMRKTGIPPALLLCVKDE
jgi:hypothetical protein